MNHFANRALKALGFLALLGLSLFHLVPRRSLLVSSMQTEDIVLVNKTMTTTPTNVSSSSSSNTTRPNHTVTYYSRLRGDGIGSMVQDMLMAHAYALQHNLKYGGACQQWENMSEKNKAKKVAGCQDVVNFMGLQDMILIRCPTATAAVALNNNNETDNDADAWLAEGTYRNTPMVQLFNADWKAVVEPLLRASVAYQQHQQQQSLKNSSCSTSTSLEVAVHIRRGDVTLCNDIRWRKRGIARYLPNFYYQQVIEHYILNNHEQNNTCIIQNLSRQIENVTISIYSEKQSSEPWENFTIPLVNNNNDNTITSSSSSSNATVQFDFKLDKSIQETWAGMMTADVLIMSRSSFSFLPAILNMNGHIIYAPFWHEPLPHWQVVDKNIFNATEVTFQNLEQTMCGRKTRHDDP